MVMLLQDALMCSQLSNTGSADYIIGVFQCSPAESNHT